jgi:hypothetical protein
VVVTVTTTALTLLGSTALSVSGDFGNVGAALLSGGAGAWYPISTLFEVVIDIITGGKKFYNSCSDGH